MDLQLSSSPIRPLVRPVPSYAQNPHPNPNRSLIPIPDPSGADLPTTISLVKDLAALAETTLRSVSDFLSSSSTASSCSSSSAAAASFCRCPYDPRHRMPPESLFRHSLLCSSAPSAPLLDLSFLDALRYTSSFKSDAQLQKERHFVRPLREADADLCFSLDGELGDIGSNFFYKDCPGVVTTPEPDASSRTFTLPGFLSIECANFAADYDEKGGVWMEGGVQILPSEFWALRYEVESWRDYPLSYSYAVLRVTSNLHQVKEDVLKRWVISNSPQFGILIDAAMRDHIYLLLKLCLKAIGREALSCLKLLLSKDSFLDLKSPSFECPILVGSLTWLASQLSVLYGENNGKFFTIGMLKELLIQAGSSLLSIRLGEKKDEENGCGNAVGFGVSSKGCKHGESNSIFVSQVAAAVAALHERSLLEGRINALRFAPPLSKSHLIMEHSYASARGSEERGKRPNYKPLLEYDMLARHRMQNQDEGKAKTREELLAEERDYKRRRMSYRGKKVKRTPKEVLRDIIEEYMEEIKHAGGIECNAPSGTAVSTLKCSSQSDVTGYIHGLEGCGCSLSETRKEKSLHWDVSTSDKSNRGHDLQKIHQKPKYEHYGHCEDHEGSKHKREKKYGSRSPSSHRNYARLHDQNESHGERGDMLDWNDTSYSTTSKERFSQSTSTSKHFKKEYDHISQNKSKERGRTYDSRRSESVSQDAFGDRYDPSSSYDEYGATYGDVSIGSNYLRSDKISSPRNHDQHHDKGKYDCYTRRHNQGHHKK